MQAVWICSFPSNARLRTEDEKEMHGSRRPAPDEAHAHKNRRYQWAVESSLAQLGFAVDQQLPSRGCHALGVAVVKPGLVWDGPLSPWPAAALTQRAYHQQAVNAYYIEVVQMYKFPQLKRLHLRRDGARGTEVSITLSVDYGFRAPWPQWISAHSRPTSPSRAVADAEVRGAASGATR